MKFLKHMLLAMMVLIVPLSVIGCGSKDPAIVGEWQYNEMSFTTTTAGGSSMTMSLYDMVNTFVTIKNQSSAVQTEEEVVENKELDTDTIVNQINESLSLLRFRFNKDGSFDLGLDITSFDTKGEFPQGSIIYLSEIAPMFNLTMGNSSLFTYEVSESGEITFGTNITESAKNNIQTLIEILLSQSEEDIIDGMTNEEAIEMIKNNLKLVQAMDLLGNGIQVSVDKNTMNVTLKVDMEKVVNVLNTIEDEDVEQVVAILNTFNTLSIHVQLQRV